MEGRKFIWSASDAYPRKGPKLEKGKVYDEKDFPEGAVEVWIREGVAKWIKEKKEKTGGE